MSPLESILGEVADRSNAERLVEKNQGVFFFCITVSMCEDMQIEELLFIVPKALKLLALTQREPGTTHNVETKI